MGINSLNMFNTPILIITFNRPDKLRQQLRAISRVSPTTIYVSSDGARKSVPGDVNKIQECRQLIEEFENDNTKVVKLYNETNFGLQKAVIAALDWFFVNEECGIVLEDDIYPSQSFFYFCEDMLDKYKYDKSISLITGFNKFGTHYGVKGDYFFSRFGGIWGWASWRECWKEYDVEMRCLNSYCNKEWFLRHLGFVLGNIRFKQLVKAKSDLDNGKGNFWAFQWALTRHRMESLCIVPSKSLVKNIGFGSDATHTMESEHTQHKYYEISFPLKIPKNKKPDFIYDLFFIKNVRFNNLIGGMINIFKMIAKKY